MKQLLLVLILVLQNSFTQESPSPQDLCTKGEHQLSCPASQSYVCKVDKCAVNKAACSGFNYFSYQLRISKNVNMLQYNLARYDQFLKSINKCPSGWQLTDICSNRGKCSLLEFNRSKKKFNRKPVKCNCTGEYSFECDNLKVCAVSSIACKAFTYEVRFNKTLLQNIYSCQNGNNNNEFLSIFLYYTIQDIHIIF